MKFVNDDTCDDHLVAQIVAQCLTIMRYYPTKTKMTACYNLTGRILRLFCVCGKKEDVLKLIDQFHEGMKEEVEKWCQ